MADRPDELYLIDGNSLVYRAFFALPESIATSTGFPTNAIFGFASMLVKILTEHGTKPTVVVWDAGSSGRKEVYADYKAGRSTRPDLLKEQWPHFEPLVDAFGYTNTRVEGFEADDVIATLAERAREQSIPVVIVTGDRDAFQLIDREGLVKVMATSRGITDTKLYDHAAVIERYGIAPDLIPDFYGLKGDSSDNIPGVPGIGDKTAAQLLQTYGDLEGVLGSIEQISGAKRKENLARHSEDARISKTLATMRRDLPVDLDVVAAASLKPDRSRLREVFREFELRDPLRRLEEFLGAEEAAPAPEASTEVSARVRSGRLAEIASLKADELVLVARAPEVPEGELLAVDTSWRFAVAAGDEVLTGVIDDPADLVAAAGDRAVVAYDAKALGVVPPNIAHDALLGAYLLEPARRGYPLRELLEERGLGAPGIEDDLAREAILIGELSAWQREQITARGLDTVMQQIELPLVAVLRRMEVAGVRLDTGRLKEITARVRDEIRDLERTIFELAGTEFVIGSPQQLGEILFVKLGLSKKRRGKTGFSTDARVLQAIRDEHPIVPKIERFRELSKLAQTYLDALPAHISPSTGRLHTTFQQTATATGRLSS
ncbi:MAG: DNA polymerase, partial [Thermoleophilia bacterium]